MVNEVRGIRIEFVLLRLGVSMLVIGKTQPLCIVVNKGSRDP